MKKYLELTVNKEKVAWVADYWGDRMPMMAMEELGELIQAVSKMERKGEEARDNLVEELRDVYVSLMALQYQYGIPMSEVEDEIEKALNTKKIVNHKKDLGPQQALSFFFSRKKQAL